MLPPNTVSGAFPPSSPIRYYLLGATEGRSGSKSASRPSDFDVINRAPLAPLSFCPIAHAGDWPERDAERTQAEISTFVVGLLQSADQTTLSLSITLSPRRTSDLVVTKVSYRARSKRSGTLQLYSLLECHPSSKPVNSNSHSTTKDWTSTSHSPYPPSAFHPRLP